MSKFYRSLFRINNVIKDGNVTNLFGVIPGWDCEFEFQVQVENIDLEIYNHILQEMELLSVSRVFIETTLEIEDPELMEFKNISLIS